MASYGYARVSSTDQGLTLQTDTLKAAGLGASEIAKRLRIGRASVYRALNRSGQT
jgi:DNA invertase Pin-like site-specific DNA recombinase